MNAVLDRFTHETNQAVISGSDGSAPESFSLFLSLVDNWTGIFVLGFCQQRGIDTNGMEIT